MSFPRDSAVKINLFYCTSPRSISESQHFYVRQRQEGLQILGGVGYFPSVLKKRGNNQRINTQNSVSVNAEPSIEIC